jgi:uncharacterized protein YbgA (DUF1722 family)/uncharacterized protein YbbK (DUF523 family)
MDKIKLGISSCLLGEKVRYDGGHKLDHFLRDSLGPYVEWLPVCPEVECGLPVPREAMRLVGDPAQPRLVTQRTGVDLTQQMETWATRRVKALAAEDLCGFVFKSKSPSSGLERVKVYGPSGMAVKTGVGLFAAVFTRSFPLLPVEEEGRLCDPVLRESFVERIFVMQRFRALLTGGRTLGRLVEFHTRHKLLLLSHSTPHYQALGRLVAAGKTLAPRALLDQYAEGLMVGLRLRATRAKHQNVLQHVLGYFKQQLGPDEKQEVAEVIEHYRRGFVPLVVPITLLNHYVRKYDQAYLRDQHYLQPHPVELALRNHA